MIIFGIDPGINKTGVGVIESCDGRLKPLFHTVIKPGGKKSLIEKIDFLRTSLNELIDSFSPKIAAVEDSFYSVNVKTAILLGVARGALINTLLERGLEVHQFTALQIKKAVVGYGKADKNQVKKMVEIQLGMTLDNVANDASDALACAICLGIFLNGKMYDKLY